MQGQPESKSPAQGDYTGLSARSWIRIGRAQSNLIVLTLSPKRVNEPSLKKGRPEGRPLPSPLRNARHMGVCDGFRSPGRRGYNSAVVSQWPLALSLSTMQLVEARTSSAALRWRWAYPATPVAGSRQIALARLAQITQPIDHAMRQGDEIAALAIRAPLGLAAVRQGRSDGG